MPRPPTRASAAWRPTAPKVFLADATPHELIIDGLHHWGRIFVGGKQIGEHVGGFTRFGLDVTGHQPGETDLVILVDNRIDYDRCPLHLDYFDWYHFGGIARGVGTAPAGQRSGSTRCGW